MSETGDLLTSLSGGSDWERHRTLERLRAEGIPAARVRELEGALASDDAGRRAAARMALAALGDPRSPSRRESQRVLREALETGEADLRVLAASALGESGDPGAAEPLIGALGDDAPNVVAAAADALGELGDVRALRPLAALLEQGVFWARAAAAVALGRLEDPAAVPALAEAAGTPGLEKILAEALRRINHPEALEGLERIRETAPGEALRAAGRILCSYPGIEPPVWVVDGARRSEAALRYELVEADDPAVGRLLGLSASPESVEVLLDLAGPPRRSDAAVTGLLAVPPSRRTPAILERLPGADWEETVTLLSVLPPVTEARQIEALVPFLEVEHATVRAAAAEALARAPGAEALPVLASELDREGVAPEVVRALGGLGEVACRSLVPLLADGEAKVRAAAAEALARCADAALVDPLDRALKAEPEPRVAAALLRAIGRAGGEDVLDTLAAALESDDLERRIAAVEALGLTGSPRAVPHIRRALDGDLAERHAAIRALGDVADPVTEPILRGCLDDPDPDIRRSAARAATGIAASLDAATVEALVRDTDPWIRVFGARIVARRPGAPAGLEEILRSDPSSRVREEARRALRQAD